MGREQSLHARVSQNGVTRFGLVFLGGRKGRDGRPGCEKQRDDSGHAGQAHKGHKTVH
jgi:hypothetical protein